MWDEMMHKVYLGKKKTVNAINNEIKWDEVLLFTFERNSFWSQSTTYPQEYLGLKEELRDVSLHSLFIIL